MASEFDETDFVDGDFHAAQKSPFVASSTGGAARPPTREELDSRVTETQQQLMELKRAQEGLERERAAPEEAEDSAAGKSAGPSLDSLGFLQLCKIGLAVTWPLAIVALAALGVLIFILLGRK